MKEVIPQKAVVKRDGKYLALKRSAHDAIFPGYWDFPGGKLEFGEDPVEGIRRELFEETGLRLEIGDVVFRCDLIVADALCHFVLYETSGDVGKVTLSDEHSGYGWLAKAELMLGPTEPYILNYLESL